MLTGEEWERREKRDNLSMCSSVTNYGSGAGPHDSPPSEGLDQHSVLLLSMAFFLGHCIIGDQ